MLQRKYSIMILVMVLGFVLMGEVYGCEPDGDLVVILSIPTDVPVGEEFICDGSGSYRRGDVNITEYAFDFDHNDTLFTWDYNETDACAPDGAFDGNTPWSYDTPGTYEIKLIATVDPYERWRGDKADINVTNKAFSVLDGSDNSMAVFDDMGNLFLKGTLTEDPNLAATAVDEFIFEDSSSNELMIINANDGNMYIYGVVYEDQNAPSPSGTNNFIIKDVNDVTVAYVDDPNGDLYLKGTLYEQSLN